jgi:hypothetical protein
MERHFENEQLADATGTWATRKNFSHFEVTGKTSRKKIMSLRLVRPSSLFSMNILSENLFLRNLHKQTEKISIQPEVEDLFLTLPYGRL